MKATFTAARNPVVALAPLLTDELLARYEALIEALPDSRGEVRDALRECLRGVKAWWELPVSGGHGDDPRLAVGSRRVRIVSLTDDLKAALFDAIPWPYELAAMKEITRQGISRGTEPELWSARCHLLWHCYELCNDREPLTQDKLS